MRFNYFQKSFIAIGLIAIVILFTGCPYSSSVPIDEGTVSVPAGLTGQWVSTADTASENPTYFVIVASDKFHATARKMEYSAADSAFTETLYYLTFSDVNGETFMNAREAESETYSLFKFSLNEKTSAISTSEITDYIKETFSSSKELKDFIAKNKSNSYFFTNSDETYIRK
jgi:hypothetical protein